MKSFIQKISVPGIAQSRHLPGLEFLAGAGSGRREGQSRPPGPGGIFRKPMPAAGAGLGPKNGRDPGKPGLRPGSRSTPTCNLQHLYPICMIFRYSKISLDS